MNKYVINIIRSCFVTAILLVPVLTFGQQNTPAKVTIFGQEIGAALSLPECPKATRKVKGKNIETIASESEITTICYVGNVLPTTVLAILIPDGKRPAYIRRMYGSDVPPIRFIILDGKVQGVDFKTGYSAQEEKDALYSDLEFKFGGPSKTLSREWQNDNGAKYTRYEYEWNSASHLVSLSEKTINGSFIQGLVTIYTPTAATFLAAVDVEIKRKADEERRKKTGL